MSDIVEAIRLYAASARDDPGNSGGDGNEGDGNTGSGSTENNDPSKDAANKDNAESSEQTRESPFHLGDFHFERDQQLERELNSLRGYGFPELEKTGFLADNDIDQKRKAIEGAWELTTGEEATNAGLVSFVTRLPSVTEVAVGAGVGLGAFLLAPVEVPAAIVGGASLIPEVAAFAVQVETAVEAGAVAMETVHLYESVKTRLEGFVKFNEALGNLSGKHPTSDHTPGELRQKRTAP